MPVITSPLRRTRETADALAHRWGMAAEIEAAVGEVPSPDGIALEERGAWLRDFMESEWSGASPDLLAWRARVVDALSALTHDAVVVTHYVAINAVVGVAEDHHRVISFRPGNCSITVIERDGPDFTVIERGAQAHTLVL
jgi:broad specificity phosphatase PhoE